MKRSLLFLLCLAMPLIAGEQTVTLLMVNDVYEISPRNGWGGLAELQTLLKQERSRVEKSLTTVNGDFLFPSLLSLKTGGRHMTHLFDEMDVDLVVVGNHEFNEGVGHLKEVMKPTKFKWFGSNVYENGKLLEGITESWMWDTGAFKIGLFGVVTPSTKEISNPGEGVDVVPVIEVAQKMVSKLKKQGAEVIVALTHLTVYEDMALAEAVPEIRVILGGHEHIPIAVKSGNAMIYKAGSDAHYLERIELTLFREDGEVNVIPRWEMIPNYKTPPDPVLKAFVDDYETMTEKLRKEKLARVEVAMSAVRPALTTEETSFGDFVADIARQTLGGQVAILNANSIRGQPVFPKGSEITYAQLVEALPFGNKLVLLDVTGEQILYALEKGFAKLPLSDRLFPIISGIRVVVDPKRPPMHRIVSAWVGPKPLRKQDHYRLVTSDYVYTRKGDDALFPKGRLISSLGDGEPIVQAVTTYLRKHKEVGQTVDGRITYSDAKGDS